MKTYWMRYKKKDILLACLLFLEIVFLVVLGVTFIPILYYSRIEAYGLPALNHMSAPQIAKSYTSIITYLSILRKGSLVVPGFVLTEETLQHFVDVKAIYRFVQLYSVYSLFIIVPLIISCLKDREVVFLKLTTMMTGIVFGVVGLFAALDFNAAFVLFHKIFFRNDYWYIDPATDPVINIFPEQYFAELLLVIIIALVVIHACLIMIYRRKSRQYKNTKEEM